MRRNNVENNTTEELCLRIYVSISLDRCNCRKKNFDRDRESV